MSEDPSIYHAGVQLPEYEQLALFGSFSTDKPTDSVTLNLYDSFASFPMHKQRESKTVDDYVRTITMGGKAYSVRITQASIRSEGSSSPTLIFPGPRDEIVERTLRYMAVQDKLQKSLVRDNDKTVHISLVFTLSSLRKTLKQLGHDFKIQQIRESLKVLAGSHLEVECEGDEEFHGVSSPILSNLTFRYKKDDKDGAASFVAVCFHPLAKRSIEDLAYSPLDFHRLMGLGSPLARWIAARMSNRYRQARRNDMFESRGYHIALSTILAESGMFVEARMRDNLDSVRNALKVLEAHYLNPLNPYDEVLKHVPGRGRPKIADAVFTLYPSKAFIEEIISGNAEMSEKRKKLL